MAISVRNRSNDGWTVRGWGATAYCRISRKMGADDNLGTSERNCRWSDIDWDRCDHDGRIAMDDRYVEIAKRK